MGADTEPSSRPKSLAAEADPTLTRQVEISVLTKTLAMSGTSLAEGAPKPGDVFAGRYRIETELGHGAFGVVYRAFDEGPLQRMVALKVIRFDKVSSTAQAALARERFVAEARLAGALSHGNLATIHEVGEHEHWVYMTQELAPGRDLARLLAEKNRVPLRQTIAIVRQICDGLAHAHARGIVHRDIKPANIVVHYEDGRAQVKITDFGVAQPPVGENPSREGLVAGTPGYMAPEQFLAGRIDHRADIFAVGCVLYEMLVGRRAFDGDTLSSVAQQTINVAPPAPSRVQDDLPHAMDRIVAKAIAKDVESRYEGLSELAHDLLHYEQYQYLTDADAGAVKVAESVRTRHCVLFLGLQLPVGGGGGSSGSTETGEQFISSWLAQDCEGSGRGRSLPRIAQDLELERGRGELVRRLAAAVENPRISPREILRRVARLDLSVIVMIQLAALVYGVNAIYEERPYFMVYAVDRFTLLAEKDVDFSEITDRSLMEKPGIGPLMVLAKMPEDPQERQQLMTEVVFENKPDLDRRTKYWVPYPENLEIVLARAKTLRELREKRESVEDLVDKIVADHGGNIDDLVFEPMIGKNGDFAIVLARNTGRLVDAIAVDPWLDDDLPLPHDE